MQRAEVKKVSDDIDILDKIITGGSGIDGKICKTSQSTSNNTSGTCNNSASSGVGLKAWLKDTNTGNSTEYKSGSLASLVSKHDAQTISDDISKELNRDQKGVVSSAFAKAHEGAEIVEIRSISTTSVMVNAILDPSKNPTSAIWLGSCTAVTGKIAGKCHSDGSSYGNGAYKHAEVR